MRGSSCEFCVFADQGRGQNALVMRSLCVVTIAIGALSVLVACQRQQQSMVAAEAPTAAAETDDKRQLVEALRTGGYVIYLRHGATDQSQTDSDPNNLANCATQRNLTDAIPNWHHRYEDSQRRSK